MTLMTFFLFLTLAIPFLSLYLFTPPFTLCSCLYSPFIHAFLFVSPSLFSSPSHLIAFFFPPREHRLLGPQEEVRAKGTTQSSTEGRKQLLLPCTVSWDKQANSAVPPHLPQICAHWACVSPVTVSQALSPLGAHILTPSCHSLSSCSHHHSEVALGPIPETSQNDLCP